MASYKVMCLTAVLTLLIPESASQLSVCGRASQNTRIVGGEVAPEGSWPWQVSLQFSGSHFCGGSLINNRWVLSAAHCFERVLASQLTVSLGRQSLTGPNPNEVSRTVSQIINHPDYNSATNDNDFALLRLSSPVTFTDYIVPVCLAASDSSVHAGVDTWVTGWGTLSEGGDFLPNQLMEVDVPVVGNRQCNCDYGVGQITDNMICAGLTEGGKDACQGDSGGPLVAKQGDVWIQLGVVSFGIGCARSEFPGVYTRVSPYMSWINSHINNNQPGYVTFTSTGIDSDLSVTCAGLPPPPETVTTPEESGPLLSVCGRASQNTRIVGGEVAPEGSWPWQVSLQFSGSHFCGGSLINDRWVLSAAHCVEGVLASQLTVSLGRQSLTGPNPNEVSRTVSQIINHPDYNSATNDNDFALLRLSSPVTFTDYIVPVCLAASDSSVHAGVDTWVTGWGTLSEGGDFLPNQLMEVDVPVVGNRQCNCDYGVGQITDNMICAGLTEGGKDACQGDSGGPLVAKQGDVWIQLGVVSFGIGCARGEFPGVYTRVSPYMSWINSQISSNQPGYVTFTSTGADSDLSATCPGLPPLITVTIGRTTPTPEQTNVAVTLDAQATQQCIKSFLKRNHIARAHSPVKRNLAQRMVEAFDSSYLDYCNTLVALIFDLHESINDKIVKQYRRIIFRLMKIKRLPKTAHRDFKICLVTYMCMHGIDTNILNTVYSS